MSPRPLATFGPCCRILRIGAHPPSVMHDGGCRRRHDGELGPTLLLYGQADIDAAVAAERAKIADMCGDMAAVSWAEWDEKADPTDQGWALALEHVAALLEGPNG